MPGRNFRDESRLVLDDGLFQFAIEGCTAYSQIFYSLTLRFLGFVISSIIFLVGGFYILGERRIWLLFIGSVPRILIMAFFENKEGEYHLNQSIITSYPQQSCLCSDELRKGPFSHRQLCCWMPGIEPFLVKGGKLFYHR